MKYPLTSYLAPSFVESPVVMVDIGARWGLDARWAALGESLKAYCFEADAAECERLNASAHPGATYIPLAIAGASGKRTLYRTKYAASSGLYQTQEKFFGRLLNSDNAALVSTEEVETVTLDQAREAHGIPLPDFVKLDVEGAELEILRSSNLGGTFGVFSEFRFHKAINGCAPFSEMDQHLTQRGFMLYDLWIGKQSRKALPYPGPRVSSSDGKRFFASTSGGQVMDGDALYFRDPMLLKLSGSQVRRAACLLELWGLNDCAAELLIDREKDADVDLIHCLDLLAGGSFKSYLERY
jgi:FkbM family methyltransferase